MYAIRLVSNDVILWPPGYMEFEYKLMRCKRFMK